MALKIVAVDPSNVPKLMADDALTNVTPRHLLSLAAKERSLHLKDSVRLEDMTYAILKILIHHCYDDHLDWAASMHVQEEENLSVIAEKLDALLDVLVAADRWLMPGLHLDARRQVISGIGFIVRPDNVKQVEKVADEAKAEELRKYCEEYSIENAKAVLLANPGGRMNVVNNDTRKIVGVVFASVI